MKTKLSCDNIRAAYTAASDLDTGDVVLVGGNAFNLSGTTLSGETNSLVKYPTFTSDVVDATAISQGDKLWQDTSNAEATSARGWYPLGIAAEAHAASTGGTIEAIGSPILMYGQGMVYTSLAPSTAVTNTTTETTFSTGTVTIPANIFKAGDKLRLRGAVVVTSGNSTDTLNIKVKIGSTIIAASGAIDVTDAGDVGRFDLEVSVGTIGASGKYTVGGSIGLKTTTVNIAVDETAINTTTTNAITVTATWSAASESDSCKLVNFSVEHVR